MTIFLQLVPRACWYWKEACARDYRVDSFIFRISRNTKLCKTGHCFTKFRSFRKTRFACCSRKYKIQNRKLSTLVSCRYLGGGGSSLPPHTGRRSQLGLTVWNFEFCQIRNCAKQVTVLLSSNHIAKLVLHSQKYEIRNRKL